MISNKAFKIFEMAINDYHIKDDVNQPMKNPFDKDSLEWHTPISWFWTTRIWNGLAGR